MVKRLSMVEQWKVKPSHRYTIIIIIIIIPYSQFQKPFRWQIVYFPKSIVADFVRFMHP